MGAYTNDVTMVVRNNDVEGARALREEGKFPTGVNPCNRFGESLLHVACRRGHFDMVKFLVLEVGVSASNIMDDYDRTPLHDACWTSNKTGSAYDIVDLLLQGSSRIHSSRLHPRGRSCSLVAVFACSETVAPS